MASLPFLLTIFLLQPLISFTIAKKPNLTLDYYDKTCPKFPEIVQRIITEKQLATTTTAAGTLRVFFHDCMVGGCDASLLISSNAFNTAERDFNLDQSLPGDAFDVVTRIKTTLELECPGVVSCTDILAVATRNLVKFVGGPFYKVHLGRKDSLVSRASDVEGHIGRPNMTLTQIISIFESKGYNIQEMVALTGAHTIGFSHCSEFSDRIFNYNKNTQIDPTLHRRYAEGLQKLCANYTKESGMAAFNDVITPGKFDNMYFLNLQRGLGLLASDQIMANDPRTKPFVDLYAANQTAFFDDFSRAMEKTSVHMVKTGKEGEVRHRCDAFNSLDHKQKSNNKA